MQPSVKVKLSGPSKALELGASLKSQELIGVQSFYGKVGFYALRNSEFQQKLMLRMKLILLELVITTENLSLLWYSVGAEGLRYN